jgi:hypothetical protein
MKETLNVHKFVLDARFDVFAAFKIRSLLVYDAV